MLCCLSDVCDDTAASTIVLSHKEDTFITGSRLTTLPNIRPNERENDECCYSGHAVPDRQPLRNAAAKMHM